MVLIPEEYRIGILNSAPGGFLVFGIIGALVQFGKGIKANKDKAKLEAAEKASKHDNEVSVQEDK